MQDKTIHIPHQNGELIVTINDNDEAVLCDYIGNAKVLYLPASVSYIDEDGEIVTYDVSPTIPDLSFSSCNNVEIIVCGLETHFRFGDFVFLHCNVLRSIVLLSLHEKAETSVDIDEFSFAEENYVPKTLVKYKLFLGDEWDYYHHHELYLADPGDPGYSEDTYALADYLGCVFSFMDWLVECLPSLVMKGDINPELFLLFVKKFGQYDFKEWRDRGGKTRLLFDSPFNDDTPSLTRCIPQYDKSNWINCNSEQRQEELTSWINTVTKFFSEDRVHNELLFKVENDEAVITGYVGMKRDLEIPSELNGNTVVAIGHMAFSFNKQLETIILPDSIRSIEPAAFYGCKGLCSAVIPKAVTCIQGGLFQNCTSLKCVSLPDGLSQIQANAFQNCKELVKISIPESVRTIAATAFSGCSSLPEVCIPQGVTQIEDCSFFGCESLSYVSLPDSLKSIGICAFAGCSSLISLKIPDSVTTIAGTAFFRCDHLTIMASPSSFAASFAKPTISNPFLDCRFEPIVQRDISEEDRATLKELIRKLGLLLQNDENKNE